MQETRVLVETKGTTGEETTSYWFDLPIDVAEFEEKLGVGAESGDYRIIEKVLPFADEVHEHTSVYQLNELDFMYRQLSSDMQEEYVSLLTVYENLEALYICRNVITVYPDCKSMIDVAKQKLMNDLLWSSIFVTLMANKIGGLQFGIYRNCQISSRVFHTAVAALPLTKANRSDFE